MNTYLRLRGVVELIQPCFLLLTQNQGATAFLVALAEELMCLAPTSRIFAATSHLRTMGFDAESLNIFCSCFYS